MSASTSVRRGRVQIERPLTETPLSVFPIRMMCYCSRTVRRRWAQLEKSNYHLGNYICNSVKNKSTNKHPDIKKEQDALPWMLNNKHEQNRSSGSRLGGKETQPQRSSSLLWRWRQHIIRGLMLTEEATSQIGGSQPWKYIAVTVTYTHTARSHCHAPHIQRNTQNSRTIKKKA